MSENGDERPIAFASRTLKKAEENYAPIELELLGIVWALKKFKNLLYGYKIRVKTDHSAVVNIFTHKGYPSKRLARLSLIVNDFNPVFEHKERRMWYGLLIQVFARQRR